MTNFSCHALTPDFLILGTDMGGISYFLIEDWVTVQEFKHVAGGIREIVPEPNGIKAIVVDVKSQGHVYNPVTDEIAPIRDFPDKAEKILWDNSPADKDVFVVYDGTELHTFLVNPDDTEGISCVRLGKTKIGSGQHPALLLSGEMSLQTSSGKLVKTMLATHEISPNISGTLHICLGTELSSAIRAAICR